ncbi:UBAP1-MVB12-associated (UMA)-domain containing protein 1 [Synchiropus splendidus]|uniref:UBAP1-MVB12-associated (UMA)-domain containing protein 1 n=1 Tax=Synchiropus splendidus TaxID=270530 RepID=UPI00237DA9A3|nr:UBAP1-MVB12-associated (UMA)-domain containing protein 1 [Synchiropus splendidus]
MLSFFGLRKDSKKSQSEKESEGGFVIIGETVEEQQHKKRSANFIHRSTNVIVVPAKPSCSALTKTSPTATQTRPAPVEEEAVALPDLLKDVPFTLAPHVKAIQMRCSVPCLLEIEDMKCNVSHFHYEFTLENSVLQNA